MNLPLPPRRELRQMIYLLILQSALLLPFLGQAVHMDDSIYLDIARNILQKPFHPHDFPYCFEGYCAPDMASHSHPPFISYWLAVWMKLLGEGVSVGALHAAFLPFAWLFAGSTLMLARRFSPRPLLTAVMATGCPVAMVMSHNLMSDYPNAAFWAAALAFYIHGVDRERSGWIWAAGVMMILAAFTSYPSLVVPLLCWIYAFLRRPRERAAWRAPVLPFLWMGLWLCYSSVYFGRFVLGDTGLYFIENRATGSISMLLEKLIVLPVFLAGTVLLPLNLVCQACRWLSGRVSLLALLACATITQAAVPGYAWPEKLLFLFLLTAGCLTLAVLAGGLLRPGTWRGMESSEQADHLFLGCWLGAVVLLACFVYAAASARYLMPLIIPWAILCSSRHVQNAGCARFRLLEASGLAGVALALALSAADYQAAGASRDLAMRLGKELSGWEGRVRFGAEWGLRHYLQERGFRQFISTSGDFRGGDLIVLPEVAVPYALPQDTESMSFEVAAGSIEGTIPLRLMSRTAHAGFYSSGWGWLPFSFSREPLERLRLLQVSPLVEKLPEIDVQSPQGPGWAIPSRGPRGQVDLRMPPTFKMTIPLGGPACQIAYEWRQPQDPAESASLAGGAPPAEPVFRASLSTGSDRQPFSVQAMGSWNLENGYWSRDFRLEVPAVQQGVLIFEAISGSGRSVSEVLLRNWRVLPQAWSSKGL